MSNINIVKEVPEINYEGFLSRISDLLVLNKKNPQKAFENLSKELQFFGKNSFKRCLNEILKDDLLLEKIASKSYLHGNGFYKIILEDNSLYRLRLHIWNPESHAEENIHDHRWHFASSILTGKMETEIWEDAIPGGGEMCDEYLYFGKTKEHDAYVQHIGTSEVSLKEKIIHESGDCYYMMSNEMHRIIYGGEQQISTLMCHTKDARRWGRVITKNGMLPDVEHNYLNKMELKDILSTYTSLL